MKKYLVFAIALATLAGGVYAFTPMTAVIDCGTLQGSGVVRIELPEGERRILRINCGTAT